MRLIGRALIVVMALILAVSAASSGEEASAAFNAAGDVRQAPKHAVTQADRISYEQAEVDAKMSVLTAKNQLWAYGKTGAIKVHQDGTYVDSRPAIPMLETKAEKAF